MKEQIGEIAKTTKEKAKKVAALAAIGGAGILASGCGEETHTLPEAKKIAANKYKAAWNHASPAGKFLIQYLRVGYADVSKHRTDDGYIDSTYTFAFNDGCLGGTSYDIAGGKFDVSASAGGFLSHAEVHAEGTIPAAAANAYVSDKKPDVLSVESGHDNSRNLTFSGVEGNGELVPVGQQTKNVLNTWGCQIGPKGYEVVNTYTESVDRNLYVGS